MKKLNCKPGDLAIVVAETMANVHLDAGSFSVPGDMRGKVVRCVSLKGVDVWEIEPLPVKLTLLFVDGSSEEGVGSLHSIEDRILRPLPDGDDETVCLDAREVAL